MGCCSFIFLTVIVVFLLKLFDKIKQALKPPPVPYLEETWWGPRDQNEEDTSIEKFKIEFPDEVINDLKNRLNSARPLIPPLPDVQQNYGMNSNLLRKIIDHWKTEYNFKEQENFLNKYPHFRVSIQGLKIHYIHVKPENTEGKKILPLLLLHGWPGSIREFYEMIPLLTSPRPDRDFVFEIIAPSLPGYGFSEGAVRSGLGPAQMALVFKNLMKRLGFEKYYVQGGDWGSLIIQQMAVLYPDQLLGMHSNMCSVLNGGALLKLFFYSFWPTLLLPKEHVHKVFPLSTKFANMILETGYMHLQSTKPDTVGFALNDSPVGLAAYILEKFTTWTNPAWKDLEDGGLLKKYTYTALLDNVMIYWVTNSITTSMRLYAEAMSSEHRKLGIDKIPIKVPTAIARFTYDLLYSATPILKTRYMNILHVADYDAGHFPAFEEPKILSDDIFEGIEKIEAQSRFN